MSDSSSNVPDVAKDFVFDLHDAVRRSARVEDVQQLYEVQFKEITEKHFHQSQWPDAKAIASEVGNDEDFLLFYRELAMRHFNTLKLKSQVSDHISSWKNYVQLFNVIMTVKDSALTLTTQWIYDIVLEFVYQYQGFCQYRSQVANLSQSNPDIITQLTANKDVWNTAQVVSILKKLVKAGKAAGSDNLTKLNDGSSTAQFGYFAAIELARVECLSGDFSSSLAAIAHLDLTSNKNELFSQVPLCHFNTLLYAGTCNLLLLKLPVALNLFNELVSQLLRHLKPGGSTNTPFFASRTAGVLPRQLDKALALTAISTFLFPAFRVDNEVREALDAKFSDKLAKLQNAETFQKTLTDLFEFAAPKFVSPSLPDYSVMVNSRQDAANHIQSVFLSQVEQYQSFGKQRAFLDMYSTIGVDKMARFNDTTEQELAARLVSFKNKTLQQRSNAKATANASIRVDSRFYVEGNTVVIDNNSSKAEYQNQVYTRFFSNSTRKHDEIVSQLDRAFAAAGLE